MTSKLDRIQENANRYIVKNCPSCKEYNVFGVDTDWCCYDKHDYCKNITDCVIKQVIEKCKKHADESIYCGHCSIENLGYSLLNMFDIEEINK